MTTRLVDSLQSTTYNLQFTRTRSFTKENTIEHQDFSGPPRKAMVFNSKYTIMKHKPARRYWGLHVRPGFKFSPKRKRGKSHQLAQLDMTASTISQAQRQGLLQSAPKPACLFFAFFLVLLFLLPHMTPSGPGSFPLLWGRLGLSSLFPG